MNPSALRAFSATLGLGLASFSLAACGSDEGPEEAAVLELDELNDPSGNGETPGGGGEKQQAIPAPPADEGEAEQHEADESSQQLPVAQPASGRAGASGLRALDSWHRAQADQRADVLRGCTDEAARALREHAKMTTGGAKGYRASLRLEVPDALGDEFAKYAKAYADGGLTQLATALPATPDPSPAWMVWTEALAFAALDEQSDRIAGPALGRLLYGMLSLGYDRQSALGLGFTAKSLGGRAGNTLPYDEYVIQDNDSLYAIRRKFRKEGRKLNYRWIADFNEMSSYTALSPGRTLKIPQQELRIEVWRGARVTAVFAGDWPIRVYTSSMGKPGEETPLGDFTLGICEKEPVYYGVSPAVPFGNPENPLGERWLGFEEKSSYGIHGTNSEETIGSYESEGCVRLLNSDVIDLFDLVPTGTPVSIHP